MTDLVWIDNQSGYRCPDCFLYVCIPQQNRVACPRCSPPATEMRCPLEGCDANGAEFVTVTGPNGWGAFDIPVCAAHIEQHGLVTASRTDKQPHPDVMGTSAHSPSEGSAG